MGKRASKRAAKSPDLFRAFDLLAERARNTMLKAQQAAAENKPRSAFIAITEAAITASCARLILGEQTTEQFEQFAASLYMLEAEYRIAFEEALAYGDLLEIGERDYAAMSGPADDALNYLTHLNVRM